MTGTDESARGEPALLGIYLNDHLAGATGGLELARRTARATRGSRVGSTLDRIVTEVEEDRESLLAAMRALGVPVRQYKVYAGWLGERLGRLKLNGHLLDRSPLSTLVELEALRLGVEGKAAGWRTLRTVAERDQRLDVGTFDRLIGRAREHADTLEELRVQTAAEIFS